VLEFGTWAFVFGSTLAVLLIILTALVLWNLRLKLLEQLLFEEIHRRQKQNLAKAKSFRELLEKTLQRYHGRIIDAAAVVQEMIKMRQEMEAADARATSAKTNWPSMTPFRTTMRRFTSSHSCETSSTRSSRPSSRT
jgi:Domain of unknown function (DUF3387)